MAVLQPEPISVRIEHGILPPFRPRRAAFFANLLSLFFGNEAETNLLKERVGGIESYGGRLIPILNLLYGGGPTDLILEEPPSTPLLHYFADTLGLDLPNLFTLSHQDYLEIGTRIRSGDPLAEISPIPIELREHQLETIDGYVTDTALAAFAEYFQSKTLTTVTGSRQGNNKKLLHEYLELQGLPVFDTILIHSANEVAHGLTQLRRQGYRRAVLKSQVGASGIGIQKLETEGNSIEIPDLLFKEGPCLLQGWLEPGHHQISTIQSPSIQLYLDEEDGIFLYDVTDQILGHDSVHQGNISPPPYLEKDDELQAELDRQASVAAQWLFEKGYRGTASVDFLVATRDGPSDRTVYVCEINARVTGATYPSILARHFLPQGAWLLRNLKFTEPQPAQHLLDLLSDHQHLFHPGKPGGVLPINFNSNEHGKVLKGQFLCLGEDVHHCQQFLQWGEEDLPVDWDYIRD